MEPDTAILEAIEAPAGPARELTFFVMPAQDVGSYAAWLSVWAVTAPICDRPRVIELDEITKPFSIPQEFVLEPEEEDVDPDDFGPPLVAAGHIRAFAKHVPLPPVEWDE